MHDSRSVDENPQVNAEQAVVDHNASLAQSATPVPRIGTMEIIFWIGDDYKTPTLREVPVLETFEFRGETFALILDHDYFLTIYGDTSKDYRNDVLAWHLGTGVRAASPQDWGSPEFVKQRVAYLWAQADFVDLYAQAKRMGAIPVRGTIRERA
jgi:hypothetical protein